MPLYEMTVQYTLRGVVHVRADDPETANARARQFHAIIPQPEVIDYQIVDEPRLVEVPTVEEP